MFDKIKHITFESPDSHVIGVPGLFFSVLGIGSGVPYKIRILGLGSHLKGPGSLVLGATYEMGPRSWVLGFTLWSRVSDPGSLSSHGSLVLDLGPNKILMSQVPWVPRVLIILLT